MEIAMSGSARSHRHLSRMASPVASAASPAPAKMPPIALPIRKAGPGISSTTNRLSIPSPSVPVAWQA